MQPHRPVAERSVARRGTSRPVAVWTAAFLVLAGPGKATAQTAATFQIIAHPGIPVEALSRKEISDLFLKKAEQWRDGTGVVPVDQVPTAQVREAFSREIHGRSAAQIRNYWQQQLFAGRAVPPVEKLTDAEVVAFVRQTPGAIGYVARGTPVAGVKVIRVEAGEPASSALADLTPPRPIETVEPEYPLVAHRARAECVLSVEVLVDEEGAVQNPRVIQPCRLFAWEFERAALKAIRRWRFEPARRPDGSPVAVNYVVDIRFSL